MVITLAKPTYYLWRNNAASPDEYKALKERYTKAGFRVVTFQEKESGRNLQESIQSLLKNHVNDSFSSC